jgi:hypothetical protein
MADLLASNVTVLDAWTTGDTSSKRNVVKRIKWTSTTAGGYTNKLVATAFGLVKILRCGNILLDAATKQVYPAVPSADGAIIVASNPAQATDANRADPADIATSTDFAYCTIEGV